jgi:hypothetical protein
MSIFSNVAIVVHLQLCLRWRGVDRMLVTRSQVSSQAQGWALVSRMRKWGELRARSQHSTLEGVEGAC